MMSTTWPTKRNVHISSPELPALLQKLIGSRSLKYNLIICGS